MVDKNYEAVIVNDTGVLKGIKVLKKVNGINCVEVLYDGLGRNIYPKPENLNGMASSTRM